MIGRHFSLIYFTLTARVLFSLQQWSVVALLARLQDTTELGLLGLSLALVTAINALFNLGLRQGVATDISGEYALRDYWRLRVLSLLVSLVAIPGIIMAFWDVPNMFPVVLGVVAIKTVDLMSEFGYGFMQLRDRILSVAISQILRALFGTAAFATIYLATRDLVAALAGWAISWIIVFLLYDRRILNQIGSWIAISSLYGIRQRETGFWALLRRQSPFGLAAGLGQIALAAPRVILEKATTLETVGIFTALWSIFQAGETLVITMMQTYLTNLARAIQSKKAAQARHLALLLIMVSIGFSAAMFLGAVYLGHIVLELLYGASFVRYADIFAILAGGWSVRYVSVVLRNLVTAQRAFWANATLTGIGGAFTVGACFYAITLEPSMEFLAYGFAAGQLASLILMSGSTAYILRRMK